ncbi:MAG: TerC family protein [Pseudomonadota bacterium]
MSISTLLLAGGLDGASTWGEYAFAFGGIIITDLVLSGDNALIIGMVAASLAPELRKKAILYGMVIAAVLRIVFAVVATKLLGVPGLLFVGALLLFWVCWRLYKEIRENLDAKAEEALETAHDEEAGYTGVPRRSFRSAMFSIMVADVSMSLDNVLAVAALADGDTNLLIFGLALAIVLMAFAATLIMKLLTRYPIISWVGLAVLLYVASDMLYRGLFETGTGIVSLLGLAGTGSG